MAPGKSQSESTLNVGWRAGRCVPRQMGEYAEDCLLPLRRSQALCPREAAHSCTELQVPPQSSWPPRRCGLGSPTQGSPTVLLWTWPGHRGIGGSMGATEGPHGGSLPTQPPQVTILEADNRIGGRIFTFRDRKTGWIGELGAMRMPSSHR